MRFHVKRTNLANSLIQEVEKLALTPNLVEMFRGAHSASLGQCQSHRYFPFLIDTHTLAPSLQEQSPT